MDNSQEIVDLLREIKNELQYITSSVSDMDDIRNLLKAILSELKKS